MVWNSKGFNPQLLVRNRVMNTYVYTDHKTKKVVFQVKANNILDADKEFEKQTGINPVKTPHVSC